MRALANERATSIIRVAAITSHRQLDITKKGFFSTTQRQSKVCGMGSLPRSENHLVIANNTLFGCCHSNKLVSLPENGFLWIIRTWRYRKGSYPQSNIRIFQVYFGAVRCSHASISYGTYRISVDGAFALGSTGCDGLEKTKIGDPLLGLSRHWLLEICPACR